MAAVPEAGEVHVWIVDLGAADTVLDLSLSLLSLEEMKRLERLRVPAKRVQFALTRACLRKILSTCAAQPPALLDLALGEHGKPFLRNSPWEFNTSHSGPVAAIAVALGKRVGVDIERIGNHSNRLTQAAGREWTASEAYIKAQGLALPIKHSGFDLKAFDPTEWDRRWTHRPLSRLPTGYLGSLTAEGEVCRIRELQVGVDALLQGGNTLSPAYLPTSPY